MLIILFANMHLMDQIFYGNILLAAYVCVEYSKFNGHFFKENDGQQFQFVACDPERAYVRYTLKKLPIESTMD